MYLVMSRFEDPVCDSRSTSYFCSLSYLVPLYWTQHGYGLKPPPVLSTDRTHEQNMDALKRHFRRTVPVYGPHVCATIMIRLSLKSYDFLDYYQLGGTTREGRCHYQGIQEMRTRIKFQGCDVSLN